jgi:hypothetical protein
MSNISTSINLAGLVHSVKKMKGVSGEIECLVIPIDKNMLIRGEKGLYLNLIGFELKEQKDNSTHLVKQSFKKEYLDTLTDEEKQAFPILGNHLVYSERVNSEIPLAPVQNEEDDLPF